jgi:hypothetical protein
MATFHYDVSGAEPIVRDIRVYSASALYIGQVMASGAVATAENTGAAISADADVLSNIIGVMNEDLTAANATSVVATGVDKYGKLIINPCAVWLCKYSTAAADDIALTAADATGKTATVAAKVTDHERGWVYITDTGGTTGGFGNLFQIGASTGTTVETAATSYDDYLKANIIGDTIITLHAPYGADVAGGSVDMATNVIDVSGHDASASAGAAVVLENYIKSKSRPMEPLVCSKHSGINYKGEDPDFYADVYFVEHLLLAGGVVNNRVIT